MIRHIVMWKFRPGTEAEQAAFLEGLRGLMGVVPQLRRCEVARNVGAGSYDAVLLSDFDSLEDLAAFGGALTGEALLSEESLAAMAKDTNIKRSILFQSCYNQMSHELTKKATRIQANFGWRGLGLHEEVPVRPGTVGAALRGARYR